jgi:hypothetical protein
MWPESVPERLYRDYVVTEEALALNRARIADRMPINAKFTNRNKPLAQLRPPCYNTHTQTTLE